MGADIYLRWNGMTEKEKEAQIKYVRWKIFTDTMICDENKHHFYDNRLLMKYLWDNG